MLDILIYGAFFGIPIAVIILFVICLRAYLSAKRIYKTSPDPFSEGVLKKRKIALIITSIVASVIVLNTVGITVLVYFAIAYM